MRYKDFVVSSVSTRISLHKNARSLRPLFAFMRTPSFKSFLGPIYLVGAVRSSRLFIKRGRTVPCQSNRLWDIPLANPELLRDLSETLPALLVANSLVDVLKNGLRHLLGSLDATAILTRLCIMYDLRGVRESPSNPSKSFDLPA